MSTMSETLLTPQFEQALNSFIYSTYEINKLQKDLDNDQQLLKDLANYRGKLVTEIEALTQRDNELTEKHNSLTKILQQLDKMMFEAQKQAEDARNARLQGEKDLAAVRQEVMKTTVHAFLLSCGVKKEDLPASYVKIQQIFTDFLCKDNKPLITADLDNGTFSMTSFYGFIKYLDAHNGTRNLNFVKYGSIKASQEDINSFVYRIFSEKSWKVNSIAFHKSMETHKIDASIVKEFLNDKSIEEIFKTKKSEFVLADLQTLAPAITRRKWLFEFKEPKKQ